MNIVRKSLALLAIVPMLAFAASTVEKCPNAGNPSQPFWAKQYHASVAEGLRSAKRGDLSNALKSMEFARNAKSFGCVAESSKMYEEAKLLVDKLRADNMMSNAVQEIKKGDYRTAYEYLTGIPDALRGRAPPENFGVMKMIAEEGIVRVYFERLDKGVADKKLTVEDFWSNEKGACETIARDYRMVTTPDRCKKYLPKQQ